MVHYSSSEPPNWAGSREVFTNCSRQARTITIYPSRNINHMNQITFADWKKLELRVGKIIKVERVPETDKLYKLQVDVGGEKPIQIVTSLVPYYKEAELQDKKIIVLVNLAPAKFAGEVSEGMLLCAENEDGGKCVLLTVEKDIEPGTKVT